MVHYDPHRSKDPEATASCSLWIEILGTNRAFWGHRYPIPSGRQTSLTLLSQSEPGWRGRCGAGAYSGWWGQIPRLLQSRFSAKVQDSQSLGAQPCSCWWGLSICWCCAPPSGDFAHDQHKGCGWCILVWPSVPRRGEVPSRPTFSWELGGGF